MNTWNIKLVEKSNQCIEQGIERNLFDLSLKKSQKILNSIYQENFHEPSIGIGENGTIAMEWFGTEYEICIQTDITGHTEVYREQIENKHQFEIFNLISTEKMVEIRKIKKWISDSGVQN